jgi:hypothetical protein
MLKNKVNVMALSVLFVLFFLAHDAQAQVYESFITEPFTGTTAPDWLFLNAAGDGPFLTSGNIDRREGWLRLTSDKQQQNSFVYYQPAITTAYGFVIEFDFVIWTENGQSADGFAVVLFDALVTPSAGGWGGSLGYAQHSDYLTPPGPGGTALGMNGGFTAFGFDTWGNFANPTEERIGGPGLTPYSVTLRGPQGAVRTEGYEYLAGTESLDPFSKVNTTRRPGKKEIQSVRLTMTPGGDITIEMKVDKDPWQEILAYDGSSLVYPDQLRIGFAASTGGSSSVQELRNFDVAPITEPACYVDSDCLISPDLFCFGYICEAEVPPLLIELGSLDATWEADGVAVSWITETELDNAHFNVYRAESIKTANTHKKNFLKKLPKWLKSKKASKKGPYVKINAAPIPALGESPYGAFYEVIDTNVQYGKRYWYKLEDVDLFGVSTQHGPCGAVSAWEDCSYMP